MGVTSRSSDRPWSLRMVAATSGVTLDRARAAVRRGHLNGADLSGVDCLVLRVSAMLPGLQPFGETQTHGRFDDRDRAAVQLVRDNHDRLPPIATLVVTADSARLALTLPEVCAAATEPVAAGEPYLTLPVGAWAADLLSV